MRKHLRKEHNNLGVMDLRDDGGLVDRVLGDALLNAVGREVNDD